MRPALRLCAALALACLAPFAAAAQENTRLIADQLEIAAGDTLVATGNVEVFYLNTRLTAQKITYDRTKNRLAIEGPILLDDGKTVTVLGQSADLSDDLKSGLITSARVIIDQQLQVTAGAVQRIEGRYNTMHRAAASSCQPCKGGEPLWEIRAKRVVHDALEQQMYFDGAQFRMLGVPLAYFPRLRMADPTLKRATGFLVPRLEVSSNASGTIGATVKLPYFITLGQDKDLTITPSITTTGTRNTELRYRQAFATGSINIDSAINPESLQKGQVLGYVLATGNFTLPYGYTLALRGETVNGVFSSYGLTEKDRFVTSIDISRASRDQFVKGRALGLYSVRASDNNITQPSQIIDFERQERFDLGIWGEALIGVQANARQRASTDPLDGSDSDTAADGRDVGGYGVRFDWRKGAVLPFGVLAMGKVSLRADAYRVTQDAVYAGNYQRSVASFSGQLRWPLIKTAANGGVHTIEPIAQAVVAPAQAQRLFNDDSALVDFDEGNLFSLNRFPGSDRIETGNRANIGLNYTYAAPDGTRAQLALGRVISTSGQVQFSAASGLGQARSDWLVAGQLDMNNRFGVTLRSLWKETGTVRKLELRGAINTQDTGISMGYLFAPADPDEGRSTTISEITLFANQKLSQRWNGSLSSRYDAVSNRLSTSGLAMVYRNECLQLDLSLSRSFASSTTVTPTTTFGMSVQLLGFGGQPSGVAEQCRG